MIIRPAKLEPVVDKLASSFYLSAYALIVRALSVGFSILVSS